MPKSLSSSSHSLLSVHEMYLGKKRLLTYAYGVLLEAHSLVVKALFITEFCDQTLRKVEAHLASDDLE
jgi:hypothetical protein